MIGFSNAKLQAMSIATEAIIEACAIVGSQSALAAAIGVSPSMVNQWVKGERPIPPDKCAAIERLTVGKVTVDRLSPPNSLWTRVRDKNWPHASGRPLLDVAGKAPAEAA